MTPLLHILNQQLRTNSFASGGLLLMALGAVLASLRSLPTLIGGWLRDQVVTTLTVRSEDPAYMWIRHWLDAHPSTASSRNLQLNTAFVGEEDEVRKRPRPRLLVTPGVGVHLIRHRGRWFWLTIDRDKDPKLAIVQSGRYQKVQPPAERLTIGTVGNVQAILRDLVEEAYGTAHDGETDGKRIYMRLWGDWRVFGALPGRAASTLVFQDGLWERVVADVERFLDEREWYRGMGIRWKRGYLLHGAPGNGKTSLVLAVAAHLGLDLYVLNLAAGDLSDEDLFEMLAEVPKGQVILIEDVDTVFQQRDRPAGGETSRLSFGGLLNALDGFATAEGSLLFMTTNHIERLDPALIRPGRIDVRLPFGNASVSQAVRLFLRFFPTASESQREALGTGFKDGDASMAALQEACLRHRHSAQAALDEIWRLTDAPGDPADAARTAAETGAMVDAPEHFKGWQVESPRGGL